MKPSLKTISSAVLAGLIFVSQPQAYAAAYDFNTNPNTPPDSQAQILNKIFKSLVNFGSSFGFKISPEENNPNGFTNPMPDLKIFKTIEMNVVRHLFYVMSRNNNFQTLFGDDSTYAAFDKLGENLFSKYPMVFNYIDVKQQSSNAEQGTKQDINPVTQYVLNILNFTPWDVCVKSDKNNFYQADGFNYLNVMIIYNSIFNTKFDSNGAPLASIDCKAIQGISDTSKQDNIFKQGTYFNFPGYNNTASSSNSTKIDYSNLSKKLDSSTFLSPLIYKTGEDDENNQLKSAQAFFRYITGSVTPPPGPSAVLMSKMVNTIKTSNDPTTAMRYFITLGNYILSTRIYAARQSVGIQSIYEILSKRMPISDSTSSLDGAQNKPTSQALNEFNMATYRLFAPSNTNNNGMTGGSATSNSTSPWQDMINTASTPVIQKETALLLAEINYQMYLMRQQQEKLLLTNSLLLVGNLVPPTLQEPEQDS
jgi:hypothetical protein